MGKIQYILLGLGVILIAGWLLMDSRVKQEVVQKAFEPNDEQTQQEEPEQNQEPQIAVKDLTVPWEVAFLPDGDMLVTERGGKLKRLGNYFEWTINGVRASGEGGLLGLALHPKFSDNNLVYVYFTTTNSTNKVVRYRLNGNQLNEDRTIIENIPGANNHDGGRIAFGPDGLLYITTGDAQDESASQDTNSLAGKILRITDNGDIPSDNPFNNAVYSYGHRNPQGLAWDSRGRLWATEHGRSGISTGLDEVNLIEKGANYGWPVIQGDETKENMKAPVAHSGANNTWAPAGLAIHEDTLYFVGLRGQAVYQAKINGDKLGQVTSKWNGQFGRLRAAKIHNGHLYFSSSNADGRGRPETDGDKIYRVKL